jgi:4-amino-4-deoxy-L-arabinose transferase-like glycosyltransferase
MVRLAPSVHPPSNASRRRACVTTALALAAIVGVALFFDLGRPAFWDPGESRYAETVREMLLTRNWIAPTLNFTRYYDKPPAYFWLVAGTFAAFGTSEWAARLPAALAGALTIATVVAFAWRRLGPRAALGAGAILATSAQFVALGRSVRMDMLLTFVVTGTLLQAFVASLPRGGPRARVDATAGPAERTWPLYVLPALGILVKGPVAALLPILVVATYLGVTRTIPRAERWRPGFASFAALAVLAAWYTVDAIQAPDYLWTFLVQHNLGRFFGRALAGHQEPFFFYCWILPITFLPWTLFLPGALRGTYRRARRGDRLATFLLLWCGVPFVFFSLSRAKLATYLLPIFPALALIVARYLDRVVRAPATVRSRALPIPLVAWSVGMALVAVGTPIGVAIGLRPYRTAGLPALLLAVFPVLGWFALRRGRLQTAPILIVAGMLAMQVLFYRVGAPVVDDFASLRDAALIARDLPASSIVFSYKTRGHSFTYYGGQDLLRVRTLADAADVLARQNPTAVLLKKRHLEKIRRHLRAPVCLWWQSPSGTVLLANVPSPKGGGRALLPATASTADGAAPQC